MPAADAAQRPQVLASTGMQLAAILALKSIQTSATMASVSAMTMVSTSDSFLSWPWSLAQDTGPLQALSLCWLLYSPACDMAVGRPFCSAHTIRECLRTWPILRTPWWSKPWCVSCVTGKLIKLDMTQMGLACEFPYAEVQAFQSLTSISFQGNDISGDVETIGASVKGLARQLTYLDLSFNSINGSFAGDSPTHQIYHVTLSIIMARACTARHTYKEQNVQEARCVCLLWHRDSFRQVF